jgi:hypothetical protein
LIIEDSVILQINGWHTDVNQFIGLRPNGKLNGVPHEFLLLFKVIFHALKL